MTENAESPDAGGLPPPPGSDQGPGHDSSMSNEIEPAIIGPKTGSVEKPGNIVPDMPDIDSDPVIAPPQTESRSKPKDKDEFLGRTFGGYELVETIGHGGMGTVYKGRQVSLDRVVAVKLLLPALVDNEEFIRRFEREAKSIAKLSHPNIVAVLDFGVSEDGVYFMVIEFVQGTSLAEMIAEKLMLGFDEYLPIVSQCLAGLDHVSRHGVIHRDIKPDNILVDETGVAKLADFGLAKDVSEDNNQTDLTVAGSAMGTPAYMSPEQCMGRPLDVRSDIYAFGVTSYLALTGEKPFKGNSGFEVMTKQREYVPPAPHELNPQVNKKVSQLIMQMLEKKPPKRFPDAEACRLAWLALGEELGVIVSSKMRSGEWNVGDMTAEDAAIPVPVDPNISAIPVNVPAPMQVDMSGLSNETTAPPPSAPVPDDAFTQADQVPPPPGAVPDPNGPPSQSVARGPGQLPPVPPPAAPAPVPAAAPAANPIPAAPVGTTPEFSRSTSDVFDANEMRTCPQCGTQSKMQYTRCQNCGFDFSEEQTGSVEDQLKRADDMMAQGKLKDAMTLYGKLADQTDDRKLRSVIRSKERGARKKYEDGIFDRIAQRSDALVEQGDIKGGIEVLEKEINSGNTSPELSDRLNSHISTLRIKYKKKGGIGFKLFLIFMFVLCALAAAVIFREHIPGLAEFLEPYLNPNAAGSPGDGGTAE